MPLLPDAYVTSTYGESAQSLLHPLQVDFGSLAQDVTEQFFGFLTTQEKTETIIRRLLPERFEWLKKRLVQHLALIMSDELTHATHLEEASKIGRVHALVNVEIRWVVETYAFYQEEAQKMLSERVPDIAAQQAINRVIAQRLLQDLEGQASGSNKVATEVTNAFSRIDQVVLSAETMADLIRDALEIIGILPGEVASFFARVDELGVLQIEQSYGEAAEQYHRTMEAGDVPKISIDPKIISGNGPGGQAWRSGNIVASDAWLIESDKKPWREVGEKLGFRSSAAVPLLDDSGRTIALLSLYAAWPGYFSTESIRSFLSHLQQVLSRGVQQRMNAPVVPLREQQFYRGLLAERRVVMHYQPIVNLRDGNLVKIEALARLTNRGGELIPPLRFLPALGNDELLELFNQGMAQICTDLGTLRSQGVDTRVAINLPAEGLDDPRYEESIFNCLKQCGLSPHHFQVELLETQDAGNKSARHYEFVHRLRDAGVQIAQDDLGSGHSSLLRMDQYPFDEVKIDQGLVRGALHNPKRAVEFILYLTRLAHAFKTRVTVEGLENAGMIEAAAILGADYGQGYGIAKPMPLEQFSGWYENYEYTVSSAKPRTAIGALAGYLLWDNQLATISERPELASDFVGSKVIVEQFIKANDLQDGPIDRLLSRSHELFTSNGAQSEEANEIRTALIKELTDYWLKESHSQ